MKAAPKFDQLVAGARQNGFRRIVVRRSGHTDIVFYGALIASAHLDLSATRKNAWRDERWTDMSLFVLRSGRFAVVRERLDDLRSIEREAAVCTESKLAATLGHGDLAKLLCELAGVDAAEWLEDGSSAAEQAGAPVVSHDGKPAAKDGQPAAPPMPEPRLRLFDPDAVERRLKKLAALNDREMRRAIAPLEKLKEGGEWRALAQAPHDALARTGALRERFPNFGEALEFIDGQLSLVLRTEQRGLKLPPMLLEGPAGVGKTRFARELARLLETRFELVSMASTTAGFILSGLGSQWYGARPGKVAEILAESAPANPLILLDELDKARGDERYDALGAFYALLEPATASRFEDECLALALDASGIIWIATANEPDAIPGPILSRLKRIAVRAPTRAEMQVVVESVYADLRGEQPWGALFAPGLAAETVERLSGMAPRALREVLVEAMGRASLGNTLDSSNRLVVLPTDIEAAVGRKAERRPIGFAPVNGRVGGGLASGA